MGATLTDTHVHLDAAAFDVDRANVLAQARAAGVVRFVVPAVDVHSFDRVAALSRDCADIHHALGIHPLYVMEAAEEDVDVLETRLGSGSALAVGEIGLDAHVTDVALDVQERYFVAQLRLAQRFGLPVILHVRRAVDAILKQLRRIEVCGGIAHAFNGSRQQADTLIAMGFKLGFGGAMTFEGSRRIRSLASSVPLDAIVLETDAPDMAPAWGQGRRNEPANLARYAEVLARLRGIDLEEVAAATSSNAEAALPDLATRP